MEPTIKFKGGGSFVRKQPKFSRDGQTIFVAWNNIVVAYNVRTARRLREYCGLWTPIAGFDFHYMNETEHLTACSTSGEVLSWRVELGLRVIKLELPLQNAEVQSFQCCSRRGDEFLVCHRSDDGKRSCFGTINLAKGKWHDARVDNFSKAPVHVAVRPDSFFGVAQGGKLFFVRLKGTRKIFERKLDKGKCFTCISCHPEDECIITGDTLGRVLVWYGFSDINPPPPAVFHWHTLPVRCLSFSTSGASFYSGGEECVLVKWHLDDPHLKNFLPRLTSTLEHISVADENVLIAVAMADNAVRILDSKFETVSVIQHLVLGGEYPAGIVFNHRTRAMVLNGLVGHVQFYLPRDMTLLYNLDIVGQNKLTNERNCQIENTNVTKIAIDPSGVWLATAEERIDGEYSYELRLKFWYFNTVKQTFELNTSIELPHEKSVSNVLFQPACGNNAELRCATTGNDDKFKIWQLVDVDEVHNKRSTWTCTRVGFYRGLPCTALSFSSDGSLMAVGFGPILTTWLPVTCELKCSLVHPRSKEDLIGLHFGIGDQCHLVVAATADRVSVWNLLTLAMSWTVPLRVSILVANPILPHMVVFTVFNKVFVFEPRSSEPIFVHQLDQRIGKISTAALVPGDSGINKTLNWSKTSQLFFINSKQELFCFGTNDDDDTETIDKLGDTLSAGLFNSTIPKIKSQSVREARPVRHLTNLSTNNKQLKQLLDSPVHTMLPIRLACGSILRSIVTEHKLAEEIVR